MDYPRLFTPIQIGSMTLKNRLVMPAMHHLYTDHGFATPRFNAYYWAKAEGGLGLIIVGSCRFDDYGAKDNSMSLRTDDTIPGWRTFTDGVHQRGSKVAVQLYHAGRYVPSRDVPCGKPALAPSAVYSPYTRETAPEMTLEQIQAVTENWATAAARAKRAGFDAVEILGSAGYLLSQFLSPVTNRREDRYGGSWENRCRLPLEVIHAVRTAVGADFPILFRLGGADFIPGSNTLEDAKAFAALAEAAGVDCFNVTGGWHETKVPQLPGDVPRGALTFLSAGIKEAVRVPVIMCNRICDPYLAETTLALGRADLIGMGRPMLADPNFANKAQTGRAGEIRPCVACNEGCLANTFFDRPVTCLSNALCGRELELLQAPAKPPKHLLVIGGGPAGCETAYRAAARGHRVTLLEASDRLGGQLRQAAKLPGKYEFDTLIRFYERNLPRLGVAVHLNTAATVDLARGYDAVVVACGGAANEPALPAAPDAVPIYTARQILTGQAVAGKSVVVIGGSYIGCCTAQYLARQGALDGEQLFYLTVYGADTPERIAHRLSHSDRSVALYEQGPKIGLGFASGTSWTVLQDLDRLNVPFLKNAQVTSIDADGVTVVRTGKDGAMLSERRLCDTVVVASGVHPDSTLLDALTAAGLPAVSVGNAARLGKAIDAIRAGAELGLQI